MCVLWSGECDLSPCKTDGHAEAAVGQLCTWMDVEGGDDAGLNDDSYTLDR